LNVYAESSAVLSWLLGEPESAGVRRLLGRAGLVLASCLTVVECERALVRAVATKILDEASAAERRAALTRATAHWIVFDLDAEVAERARRPFPAEPIRTLDALHLATALLARSLVPELAVVSLDRRLRGSAKQLGLVVLPEAPA
jgi:predicted nucleic acid-binding protein